ncbi:MAG: ABC transporter permease subunit [Dehalococcoidales bacterium]
MRMSKAWIVAAKDMKVFLRKKYVVYSLVIFPLLMGIGLPFVLSFVGHKQGGLQGAVLLNRMNAFSFFFLIGAVMLPTLLASYSLVGEKIEKSLEPLLATPITDSELLLGKGIAAFIPSVGAIYISSIVFMALSDLVTHNTLGYSFFPNWTIGLILLLLVPLSAILSIEWSVIVSSRASDPRAAQIQSLFIALPLLAIYVATEVGAISLDTKTLLIISAIILVADVVLFFLSTKTFQREEILTKWT